MIEQSTIDRDSELSFLNTINQNKEPSIEEYFTSNKERMMLIAHQKFDRAKDEMFFKFLDNLNNAN